MCPNSLSRFAPLTVLFVDDDPTLRSIVRSMLERLGFQTMIADHGVHAIQMVLNENPLFHLVISDFTMPHMNGVETLTVLQSLRPGLKAILCSGNTEQDCMQGKTLKDCVFLAKPFGLQDLDAAVNQVLGFDFQVPRI
jgi:DNA-binding NtrC family response regulator